MRQHIQKYLPEYLTVTLAILTLVFADYTSICEPDETMVVQGPASMLGLGFLNPSYFRCAGSPLIYSLLYGWMSIFGMSHMSVYGLNIVFALTLSLVLLRQARIRGWMTSSLVASACVILYWCSPGYAWVISTGRTDVLGLLFMFLVVFELIPPAGSRKHSGWWLFLWTFCAKLTSVIPFPPLLVLGLTLFALAKGRRMQVFLQGCIMFAAVCAALFCSCLFWCYFKDLLHHLYAYFSFGTAKVGIPFADKLHEAFTMDRTANIVSCLVLILAAVHSEIRKSVRWSLIACACLVPLILCLAGRYTPDYVGFHLVPVIACLFYVGAKCNSRILGWALLLLALAIAVARPINFADRWRENRKVRDQKEQAVAAFSEYLPDGANVINADGFQYVEGCFYPLMRKHVRLWSFPRGFLGGEHDASAEEKFERGMLKILKSPDKVATAKKILARVQSFPAQLPSEKGVVITFDEQRAKVAKERMELAGYKMTELGVRHGMYALAFEPTR